MPRLVTVPVVLLFLLPAGASAGQTPVAEPLSLERLVADVAAQSAQVRAAGAAADAASREVAAARGTWFPRLSFTESWQRGDQPTFVFSSLLASRRFAAENFAVQQLNHPDPIGYARTAATLEQVLFDGGRRRAAVDMARSQQTFADLEVRDAALTAVISATELYGRLLLAQAMQSAADAALAAGREDLARAERRRDAGMATDADVLALTVHVADMEQRSIKAGGDAQVLRAQINRLAGAAVDRRFLAVEPSLAQLPVPDAAGLFTEAEAQRPDVLKALAAEQMADSGRRAARATFLPTIGVQATYEMSGTRIDDRASSWIAGSELRWSLGAGGVERAKAQAAAARLSKARVEAEDARAAARVDVVAAVEQLRSARARQTVGRAAVAQAHESERIIRDRYDAGLMPVNDVLRAAGALLDAESQRVSALVDELTSRAALDRALGRLPRLP
jgi:outer membrane protein TolC